MAILFIAAAMVVQFVISFSLEKEHVREVVEYKMQLAQKDFFYVLLGFHNAADEMRKYVLEHPFSERELLEATRSELNRYPHIDNIFVKFAPGDQYCAWLGQFGLLRARLVYGCAPMRQ